MGAARRPGAAPAARHLRPAAEEALDPAQLPDPRPHAVPAGGDPSRAPAVLHRAQLRRSSLRPGHPLLDLPARQGHQGGAALRHRARPVRRGVRVPRPLHRAGGEDEGAAPGPDRRAGVHEALRHGAAQRLGDELRVAVGQRDPGAEPRRRQGRVRPRHGGGGDQPLPPQRRRPGLGARLGLLRRPDEGRRPRRARVRREGRRRPGEDGQPQAQPGRQARHRRGAARGQGDRGDREDPRRPPGPDA